MYLYTPSESPLSTCCIMYFSYHSLCVLHSVVTSTRGCVYLYLYLETSIWTSRFGSLNLTPNLSTYSTLSHYYYVSVHTLIHCALHVTTCISTYTGKPPWAPARPRTPSYHSLRVLHKWLDHYISCDTYWDTSWDYSLDLGHDLVSRSHDLSNSLPISYS